MSSSSTPLKIMRIIARLNIGGPAIHVILLAEQFEKRSDKHDLVCGQVGENEGDMHYLADEKNVTPLIIPELGREISLFRDIRTVYELYRLMRQSQPDIVHTHTAKAGFTGRIAAWLARVPVRVHTFHGHVFHGYFGTWKTRFFIWLERFCAWTSHRIITISPQLRDELADNYRIAPRQKIEIVPLGFDLSKFRDAVPLADFHQHYNLPTDKKLIAIIGRLVPIKNHEFFLQVAHELNQQRDDVYFVIVGDGECRTELTQTVETLGLTEKVSFLGWYPQIQDLLPHFSAVALTSHNEGTPVSLIEALSTGIPVVSTDVGGVTDVLAQGDYGRLVAVGNTVGFSTALSDILDGNHPDLVEIQTIMFERYHIDRLTDDLAQLYQNLLIENKH